MTHLTDETADVLSNLLEVCANNDVEGFRRLIEDDPSGVDDFGQWYVRKKGSKPMVFVHITPLMVASLYGSIDILKLILSLSMVDVNRPCKEDKSTALHCAASGGSVNAVDAVKLLLEAGADHNALDADGRRPFDVIMVSPNRNDVKFALEELLAGHGSISERILRVSTTTNSNSPQLSSSPINGYPSSSSDSPPSPLNSKLDDPQAISYTSEKKEYPIDPSIPDIKNSIYASDEFRMFSFKIRPCSRAYSHDWTECPFVHPGENARRRDPRKFHYSCVPCPEFRKGACRKGDMCEYAHGVFECWLHPAQYRTRLCKDGLICARRVCFFAHTPDELRSLYVSTGSAVPSPRSSVSSSMDFAGAMNFLPGSPSSLMSPPAFATPMSPSAHNNISHSSLDWLQPDVPSLRLPGSNLQSSRLRSSLNARDISAEEFDMLQDYDLQQQQQLLNKFSCCSLNPNPLTCPKPSNLDDLFFAESSSPRYNDQGIGSRAYSPTHNSPVFNQFQQQQGLLSPIKTNFSPNSIVEHPLISGRMSPRNMEPISPMSSRASIITQRQHQLHQLRSLSSRELGSNLGAIVGSPIHSLSGWGSSHGKPDWGTNTDELGKLRRSSSFEFGNNSDEPDFSWVQALVKESSPTEIKENGSGET
ncbi:unnamed protein product [Amaranthus hypochondriacus]